MFCNSVFVSNNLYNTECPISQATNQYLLHDNNKETKLNPSQTTRNNAINHLL